MKTTIRDRSTHGIAYLPTRPTASTGQAGDKTIPACPWCASPTAREPDLLSPWTVRRCLRCGSRLRLIWRGDLWTAAP